MLSFRELCTHDSPSLRILPQLSRIQIRIVARPNRDICAVRPRRRRTRPRRFPFCVNNHPISLKYLGTCTEVTCGVECLSTAWRATNCCLHTVLSNLLRNQLSSQPERFFPSQKPGDVGSLPHLFSEVIIWRVM
jgi:hypothetical protein